MVLSRLTKITGPGVATDTNWVGNNADFTGITTTATSFNIGVTTIHSTLIESHNIKSTGIITAVSFVGDGTGLTGVANTDFVVGTAITMGTATFTGNVTIGGTLTYEDVTNIDSIGIVTARDGFKVLGGGANIVGVVTATGADINGDLDVDGHTNLDNVSIAGIVTSAVNVHTPYVYMSGTQPGVAFNETDSENDFTIGLQSGIWKLRDVDGSVDRYQVNSSGQHTISGSVQINGGNVTISKDIDVDGHTNLDNVSIAGVVTATTFSGSGASLTNLNASAIASGTVPTARLGSGTANSSTFLRGDSTFAAVTSTTINNNANNRIITGSGTANTLEGEANLTFDGSNVIHAGSDGRRYSFAGGGSSHYMKFDSTLNGIILNGYGGIAFETNGTNERLRIGSNGYVNIGTGSAEQQLTVQNSAQHSLIRVIGNASSDTGVDFGDPADSDIGRIRYSNNGDYMTFRVNNINSVRFDSSGSVQIGGGDTPSQTGDGRLIVYSTDRLHPAIKCAGMSNNYANGWTLLGDNYQADESQINLGVSYSSSSLVLSRGVKVSGSADNTYLSSQDSYAMRPCAIRMDELGAFNFLTTETNATVTTDSAVSLTEVFKVDRVGNIYQRITNRYMYFGASNVLRIGTNGSDPMIDAVSGDLQIKDAGNNICTVRSDGFEMYQGIYPSADGGEDLGKSGRRWNNIYTNDLHLSNEGKSNVVDGTWGDWTLQEGESDVYMINNRSGKKFKIRMEEVS